MSFKVLISPNFGWRHAIAALLAAGITATSATVVSAQSNRYSVKRAAQADISGVRSIRVENGAGRLVITGKAGATAVNASVVVRGSSQSEINSAKLLAEREGDVLTVRVDGPKGAWSGGEWSADLTIEVPNNVQLDIRDGSGGAHLENVGPLLIASGSGGVQIAGVNGSMSLKSGSGRAQVSDVHGDVVIRTGSGGILLTRVTGEVDVKSAASGGVTVRQVSGSVHLGSIGSGSLTVDHIGGDLTVDSKGSGSVHYTDVKGKVSIPERRHHRRR